ncbi:glycosyltransferase [Pontibacter silvestris]|uniref:Glycosyltransferase n=1 Tax=Pontibacter silvestris TaxID=2305183 RepID=A0ABW4X183_9BACT|nr:glycosyltransferase [Pontibacter silvestris]MCC9138953.1 glycosyltransferase [Pontibacter silvestris]
MQAHHSYQINHVYLDKQLAFPEQRTNGQGYYLVFWWKEVALGELFISSDQTLTGKEYLKRLEEIILPTIRFYAKDKPESIKEWQRLLHNQELTEWRKWMESLFASYVADSVPASVPVSVVICTRNRSADLDQCLHNLENLTCVPEEIVVIDNAPTDTSTLQVVQKHNGVRYIMEPRPGLDIARNTGVVNAKAPIVAFVDDDVLVDPLWVYKVWEGFKDPSIAAMTGLVIASDLSTEAQYLFEKWWSFNRGYVDKVYDKAYFEATLNHGPPIWEIGAGANMAFRKSVVEEVGYFDELLDVGAAGCNGDSEMWFRILMRGYTIKYNPRAVVFHKHRKDLKDLNKQMFSYMRGHAAAALIQQSMCKTAGYNRYLFWVLPVWYLKMVVRGFPKYELRYGLLKSEITGLWSGVRYYFNNRSRTKRNNEKLLNQWKEKSQQKLHWYQ